MRRGPVRPYVITGGRSRAGRNVLEFESLVRTVPGAAVDRTALNREQQAILGLCRELLSIAEVAAHLGLPISVLKVLVGDLLDLGAVQVLPPVRQAEQVPLALLEEVLVGLRQLR
ncbi:hypothetical protein TR51_30970 [Kitasatospora griseola]|uniref:DUF742 domain-containing protein n=1 Tax=Kitasatospora griseola TaxID=2064 RepID=A0A0D0N511_KITGR|nr:hypothetical protein TR51_30970 [Kitasatospora griseola]